MRSLIRGVGIAPLALALALAGCSAPAADTPATAGTGTAPATTAVASATPLTSAPAAATATRAAPPCMASTGTTTVEATVENYQWSQPISAKVGDVITWTNVDPKAHKLRLSDGSCAMTHDIAANGGQQSLVFTTPGTYRFYCVQHVTMKGLLTIS
jgi:plastocyanin